MTKEPDEKSRFALLSILEDQEKILEALRNSEEQQLKSNAFLESIIEQSTQAMWISDENGTLLKINPACCNLLNITAEEVIGKYNIFNDNIIEEQGLLNMVRAVFEEGEPARFEIRYDTSKLKHLQLKGMVSVILDVIIFPIRDATGKITNAVIQHINISERKHAEEALKKSEAHLKTLVETIPDLVWMKDSNGVYLTANQRFESLVGKSSSEILGKTDYDFFDRELADFFRQKDKEAIAAGKPVMNEEEISFADDGHREMVETIKTPIYDTEGHNTGVLGIARNITDRKLAEEDRQKFVLLAESSSEFIGMCDLNLNPHYVNPAGMRMVGLPDMAAACRVKVQDYFFPEDQQFIAEDFFPRVMREGHGDVEIRLRHFQTGNAIWMYYYLYSVCDINGTAIGWATVSRDITERNRAEESLNKSLLTTNILFQVSKELSFTINIEEVGEKILESVERLLKWQRGSIWLMDDDKKKMHLLNHSDMGLDQDNLRKELDRVRKIVTKPGAGISGWVALHGKAIRSGDIKKDKRYLEADPKIESELCVPIMVGGNSIGSINVESFEKKAFSEDDEKLLTTLANLSSAAIENARLFEKLNIELKERKKAEKEVQQLNQELEQRVIERTTQLEATNKELESFSYSVSHDLRAPLRSIDGFSYALLEDYYEQLDEKGKNYLNRVREAAQRMAQLIDDLLNLARVTRASMNPGRVDLSAIAKLICDELMEDDKQRSAEFIITPDMVDRADSTLMKIVLQNLLDNAWKFSSKRAETRIEFGMLDKHGIRTYFIRDNGAGFNMKYADKLFSPFQRLHQSTEFPGTGIGLATIQRIIQRHKGKVWAEGEVDKGATIYFTLDSLHGG